MNLFMTGFPGFIASRLVSGLVKDRSYDRVMLLVESKFAETARRTAAKILGQTPVDIIEGDITQDRMGITDEQAWARLLNEPAEWWHLAALYRLDAEPEPSQRINVDGTRHVLEAAKQCQQLDRLNYVSTAYVSGWLKGVVREDDLPEPKLENFKNHYEHTKNAAEWLVRDAMKEGLPASIYRFGIVIGDSKTGQTQKFDGPYFFIKYVDKLRFLPLPAIGAMEARINTVPVDYVIAACVAIRRKADTVGKCFHIVDPSPITTGELYRLAASELGRRPPRFRVSPKWMEHLMRRRFVRRLYELPLETLVYANFDVQYDATNTQAALAGTGVTCPDARECVRTMAKFYQANKHRRELHLEVH